MKFARHFRQLATALAICCFGLAVSAPCLAQSLDLQTVLDRTTIAPPSRVAFREVRHNQMLKDDLVITGYLEYLQEGLLRKVIESPFEEAYLVKKDRIEIDRQGETKTLSLRKSRSLKTMLGGIEAILAGRAEQLGNVFSYELVGAAEDWSLQLRPRSKRIARQLTSLTVTGDAAAITTIRFELAGGEWHAMELLKSDAPL